VNKVNGKYYVGSSSHIKQRWYSHKKALRDKKHWNHKLQNAFNKYSIDNFEFVVVETCCSDGETLLSVEQKYLDIAITHVDNCYNITFTAGKVDMTNEIRKKISAAKIGKCDGSDNHQYKNVSSDIVNESKQIWIDGGKNKLISFLKEKYNLGGGVSRRLIREFRTDRNASIMREENMKKLAKELYYQHYVKRGSKNTKYNPNMYHLENIMTHEKFSGTQNEFLQKYGIYIKHSVISGTRKSFKGWKMI
jgi:group I intron endonuclease